MAAAPKRKNALGKGLGALLQGGDFDDVNNKEPKDVRTNTIADILVSDIETNPFQPRTDFDEEALNELAESIKVQGIIQPVTVRMLSKNKFQLISGERRTQASKLAGLKKIPAYIRKANDQQMLEMGLIENIQREDLNAMEIAFSYQRLITECKLKQEDLGERVGKKRSSVTNYLRLLKLPPDIQIGVRDNQISFGHARALLGTDKIETQISLYNKIVKEGISVRKLEELVRDFGAKKKSKENKSTPQNDDIKKLSSNLSSHFGTKINVKATDTGKGEIKIPFVSIEDLNRILDILDLKN